jgi:hypothetical protein
VTRLLTFQDLDSVSTTRRTMLRRMGSAGLLATAGAGLAGMLGTGSAQASSQSSSQSAVPVVSLRGQTVPANPDCCVTCARAEYHCGNGSACGSGECCFFCDGCGLNGFYCFNTSCANGTVKYCN